MTVSILGPSGNSSSSNDFGFNLIKFNDISIKNIGKIKDLSINLTRDDISDDIKTKYIDGVNEIAKIVENNIPYPENTSYLENLNILFTNVKNYLELKKNGSTVEPVDPSILFTVCIEKCKVRLEGLQKEEEQKQKEAEGAANELKVLYNEYSPSMAIIPQNIVDALGEAAQAMVPHLPERHHHNYDGTVESLKTLFQAVIKRQIDIRLNTSQGFTFSLKGNNNTKGKETSHRYTVLFETENTLSGIHLLSNKNPPLGSGVTAVVHAVETLFRDDKNYDMSQVLVLPKDQTRVHIDKSGQDNVEELRLDYANTLLFLEMAEKAGYKNKDGFPEKAHEVKFETTNGTQTGYLKKRGVDASIEFECSDYENMDDDNKAERIDCCRQLINVMKVKEGLGLVHRDIKPQNIIIRDVDSRKTVVLNDFTTMMLKDNPPLFTIETPGYVNEYGTLVQKDRHASAMTIYWFLTGSEMSSARLYANFQDEFPEDEIEAEKLILKAIYGSPKAEAIHNLLVELCYIASSPSERYTTEKETKLSMVSFAQRFNEIFPLGEPEYEGDGDYRAIPSLGTDSEA